MYYDSTNLKNNIIKLYTEYNITDISLISTITNVDKEYIEQVITNFEESKTSEIYLYKNTSSVKKILTHYEFIPIIVISVILILTLCTISVALLNSIIDVSSAL